MGGRCFLLVKKLNRHVALAAPEQTINGPLFLDRRFLELSVPPVGAANTPERALLPSHHLSGAGEPLAPRTRFVSRVADENDATARDLNTMAKVALLPILRPRVGTFLSRLALFHT